MATPGKKSFCVLEYHTSKSVVTVQRAFRAKYSSHHCHVTLLTCSSKEYRCTYVDACVARTWIPYRCVPCHQWCTHRTSLVVKRKPFKFSCGCEQFHYGRCFGFLVINVCNHGEHYETPCMTYTIVVCVFIWSEKLPENGISLPKCVGN